MHALILSDLHLGARNSQHQLILGRLAPQQLRHITHVILNGDVVDHLNFETFRPDDWSVIRRLQQLAHEDRLIVVQGNHDKPKRASEGCISRYVLGDILDVELKTELTIYVDSQRYLLVHGDQYDQTLNMTVLGCLAESFYRQTQRWHQPTSRWLKRQSKNMLGIERTVRQLAMADAGRRGFDGIILGHTHYAMIDCDAHGIHYGNSGSWVDDVCHYLELEEDRLELKTWQGQGSEVVKSTVNNKKQVQNEVNAWEPVGSY
jgi:UDP-2,3-diacylglucosamine pyrophosphatase LpxH